MLDIFKFYGDMIYQLYNTLNFKILDSPIGFIDIIIGCSLIVIIFKALGTKDKGVI